MHLLHFVHILVLPRRRLLGGTSRRCTRLCGALVQDSIVHLAVVFVFVASIHLSCLLYRSSIVSFLVSYIKLDDVPAAFVELIQRQFLLYYSFEIVYVCWLFIILVLFSRVLGR